MTMTQINRIFYNISFYILATASTHFRVFVRNDEIFLKKHLSFGFIHQF